MLVSECNVSDKKHYVFLFNDLMKINSYNKVALLVDKNKEF